MAANFKTMGPTCCCCRDFYFQDSNNLTRNTIKAVNEESTRLSNTAPNDPVTFDLDYIDKKIYFARTGDRTLYRTDDDFANRTTILTLSSPLNWSRVAVDSSNGQIYYLRSDATGSPTVYTIYRIKKDGTVDTFLTSVTQVSGAPTGQGIAWSRSDNRLYFFRTDGPDPGTPSGWTHYIDAINSDGSGYTNIYSVSNATASYRTINLDVDVFNRKLVWIEAPNQPTARSYRIRRCNFDGSNVETLKTGPTFFTGTTAAWNATGALDVSYKSNRYYYCTNNASIVSSTDPVGGLFSMKPDGTDDKQECQRKFLNLGNTESPSIMKAACGNEILGATYPG